MTTWQCPTCGRTVTTCTPSGRADTCSHVGTARDAARPAVMVRVDEVAVVGEGAR